MVYANIRSNALFAKQNYIGNLEINKFWTKLPVMPKYMAWTVNIVTLNKGLAVVKLVFGQLTQQLETVETETGNGK